ncbi:MAG: glycosyltransferase [Verrucomicrobia bacterium]|jgi:glycosyltransferase involved in cell wall biosynthesis|nr:glycosyltransferase [Verrucomicrobiota bacterium]MBT7064668.1 glycosyltransferase [Verrucomicrobiota bacterium]MBT7700345.1 glycosyltransferase [Verrucomicrobiota bacterium]
MSHALKLQHTQSDVDIAQHPPLRVAFLVRHVAKYRVGLYQRLVRVQDIDFRIFCQHLPSTCSHTDERPDFLGGLPVSGHPMPGWAFAFRSKTGVPLPSLRILRSLVRYRPDVVIMEGISNIGNDLLCLPYLIARRVPFVWWSLGHIPSQSHTLRARMGVPLHRWFVRHAAASLAYSSFAKRYMESLGANPATTYVVHNTLDEQALLKQIEDCRPKATALREQWGLRDRPVVVFAGTINPGKRLDALIDAFADVQRKLELAKPALVVIGDGPGRMECEKQAARLGIDKDTLFVGRQDMEASAYFLLGDVCVLPGLGGLAINHAFAHGIPVICGRADGCEEDLVFTGKTGVRLDEVSVDTLSDAMTRLLSDMPETRRMGENARHLVTTSITMDHFAGTVFAAAQHAHRGTNPKA